MVSAVVAPAFIFIPLAMEIFVPEKQHLREVLSYFFFLIKKSPVEAIAYLVLCWTGSNWRCFYRECFKRFKNNDFDVEDKEFTGAQK